MKHPPPIVVPLRHEVGGPSAALLRAAQVWAAGERQGQLAAILATAEHHPPRFVVAATSESDVRDSLPTGAVLAECMPGRACVVTAPQMAPALPLAEQQTVGASLLLTIEELLRAQGMLLAQALTTNRQDVATQMFLAAGYRLIGDLLYLGARLADVPQHSPVDSLIPFELVRHSSADEERWISLIDQTYIGTLDCPAVDGTRPTRDVLAGYRDIGHPREDWWFIVRHAEQDVGCVILADHYPANHAELVYMGLIPAARGCGWGVFLAREAQRLAAASGAEHLILSVDAANTPALRHYRTAGFRMWEQRTILIKPLGYELAPRTKA